jgi:DnaK suppressor protein
MDVATLREQLVEERERLERELRRVARDRGRPAHEAAEEVPPDPVDAAERELDDSLELNAEAVLAEIRRALERIEIGTYGTCARCQRPIAEARLNALPYANRCIDCKRLEERG